MIIGFICMTEFSLGDVFSNFGKKMRSMYQRYKQQFLNKRDEKRQQKELAENETDVEITKSESVQPEQFQEEPVIQDLTEKAYQDTEEETSDQEPTRATKDD